MKGIGDGWITRYVLLHDKRHPNDMGAPEVEAFLTHLAVEEHVAVSTQNQAFSALLLLYREVLHQNLGSQSAGAMRLPRLDSDDSHIRRTNRQGLGEVDLWHQTSCAVVCGVPAWHIAPMRQVRSNRAIAYQRVPFAASFALPHREAFSAVS